MIKSDNADDVYLGNLTLFPDELMIYYETKLQGGNLVKSNFACCRRDDKS